MASTAAATTGRCADRHPAITAFTATFSAVIARPRTGSTPRIRSGSSSAAWSAARTSSGVGGTMGSPSVHPFRPNSSLASKPSATSKVRAPMPGSVPDGGSGFCRASGDLVDEASERPEREFPGAQLADGRVEAVGGDAGAGFVLGHGGAGLAGGRGPGVGPSEEVRQGHPRLSPAVADEDDRAVAGGGEGAVRHRFGQDTGRGFLGGRAAGVDPGAAGGPGSGRTGRVRRPSGAGEIPDPGASGRAAEVEVAPSADCFGAGVAVEAGEHRFQGQAEVAEEGLHLEGLDEVAFAGTEAEGEPLVAGGAEGFEGPGEEETHSLDR